MIVYHIRTYLKKPRAVSNKPEMKVAVKTKWRYKVGFSTGDTFSPIVAAISSDDAATFPTAKYFELPNIA